MVVSDTLIITLIRNKLCFLLDKFVCLRCLILLGQYVLVKPLNLTRYLVTSITEGQTSTASLTRVGDRWKCLLWQQNLKHSLVPSLPLNISTDVPYMNLIVHVSPFMIGKLQSERVDVFRWLVSHQWGWTCNFYIFFS